MPEAGTTVGGRYQLLEPVGKGGTSTVWKARDGRTGRCVAVKTAAADGLTAQRNRARLRHEADIRIAHRNLLCIDEAAEDGAWVVMELADITLAEQVDREGPLAPAVAVGWMSQLLDGLAALHDAGWVHRDLKPDNLMCVNGRLLLGDFGLCRRAGRHEDGGSGTPVWMAPELQADPAVATVRADLYAAGAVLFHLLTASTPLDLALAGPASPRFDGIDPRLVDWIRQATALDPERRPADAREMSESLARLELGSLTPPPAPVRSMERVPTADGVPMTEAARLALVEAALHREWRDEEAALRSSSARATSRAALVIALTLLLGVAVVSGVFVLGDRLAALREAAEVERVDWSGTWLGVIGALPGQLRIVPEGDEWSGRLETPGRTLDVTGGVQAGRLQLRGDGVEVRLRVADGILRGEIRGDGRPVPVTLARQPVE